MTAFAVRVYKFQQLTSQGIRALVNISRPELDILCFTPNSTVIPILDVIFLQIAYSFRRRESLRRELHSANWWRVYIVNRSGWWIQWIRVE